MYATLIYSHVVVMFLRIGWSDGIPGVVSRHVKHVSESAPESEANEILSVTSGGKHAASETFLFLNSQSIDRVDSYLYRVDGPVDRCLNRVAKKARELLLELHAALHDGPDDD